MIAGAAAPWSGPPRRLARSREGELLVGDANGFVPATALHLDDERAALRRLTAVGLDPADVVADAVPASVPGADPDTVPAVPPRAYAPDRLARPLSERSRSAWGIGLNFAPHAADLDAAPPDRPATFLRPWPSAVGPGGPIRLPAADLGPITAEAELAVVIGRPCRDLDPAAVPAVTAGVVPVIDVTAESLVRQNPRLLVRSKSFDSFLVVGPWVSAWSQVPSATTVRTVIDGETVATGRLADMRFSPAEVVAALSTDTTLCPGDLIATGTPGAGEITADSRVRAVIVPPDGSDLPTVGSLTAAVTA